ncbi:MAG: hypothetical protein V3W41_12005 [Planctomycetota bacterium]
MPLAKVLTIAVISGIVVGSVCFLVIKLIGVDVSPAVTGGVVGGVTGAIVPAILSRKSKSSEK